MMKQKIPGICGIDTRSLTKIIRENGTILGRIVYADEKPVCELPLDPPIVDPNETNLVADVSHVSIIINQMI